MTLYVSDLDGTLLLPDATLSTFAATTLRRLLDDGVDVTVASARSLTSMRAILGDLPLRLPVVSHNGSVVGDLVTGTPLFVKGLGARVASDVLAAARQAGLEPLATTLIGGEELLLAPTPRNEGQAAYVRSCEAAGDARLRRDVDVALALEGQVIAFTLIARREVLEALDAELAEIDGAQTHLFDDLYAPGWTWITVHPADVSKGGALDEVRARTHREHLPLTVFGDQVNDLSMFAVAEHAVAVSNATDAVLQAAHEVIGANADDAVATYLSRVARGA